MSDTHLPLQTETIRTIYGQDIVAFKDDTITRKLHKKGCYDIRTIEFMRQYLKSVNDGQQEKSSPSAVYVDIGANIGNHVLPVAEFCRHMYLFEPISVVADVLVSNLENNAIENFSLFRMALSDHSYEAPIYIRKGNIGASSINRDLMTLKGDDLDQEELVSIDTGDHILGAQQPDRIDLIKIDVETHEAEVVSGLENIIQRYHPVIVLEWNHPMTAQRFEQLGLFDSIFAGYSVASISDNHRIENWSGKRLGMLRRTACHLFTQRRLQFGEFDRSNLYKNIVFYPKQKEALIFSWAGWPIPDRRFSFLSIK